MYLLPPLSWGWPPDMLLYNSSSSQRSEYFFSHSFSQFILPLSTETVTCLSTTLKKSHHLPSTALLQNKIFFPYSFSLQLHFHSFPTSFLQHCDMLIYNPQEISSRTFSIPLSYHNCTRIPLSSLFRFLLSITPHINRRERVPRALLYLLLFRLTFPSHPIKVMQYLEVQRDLLSCVNQQGFKARLGQVISTCR